MRPTIASLWAGFAIAEGGDLTSQLTEIRHGPLTGIQPDGSKHVPGVIEPLEEGWESCVRVVEHAPPHMAEEMGHHPAVDTGEGGVIPRKPRAGAGRLDNAGDDRWLGTVPAEPGVAQQTRWFYLEDFASDDPVPERAERPRHETEVRSAAPFLTMCWCRGEVAAG